jgi:acyl-CoA ligase (AMP-forming) (exosortase A-associated)
MTLLHQLLDRSTSLTPRKEALRYRGEALLYSDVQDLTLRTAAGLLALGVGRGDRVVIFVPNRPEVVEVALACSRIGAIFIPVSPMLRGRQLTHILRDSGAATLVVSDALLPFALPSITDALDVVNVVLIDSKQPPKLVRPELRYSRIEELRAHQPVAIAPLPIDRDLAAILYTSGSTGRAKGVMIYHHNLISGAISVSQYLENTPDDRLLAALPLSFDYGLSQITTAFHVGACATLTSFSMPAATVQEAAAERITGLAGVPTMWAYLAAAEWPAKARDSLRYITNSGGALTPTLIRSLRSRLPTTRLFCMYGLTEAFRSTYLEPAKFTAKMGAIGRAIPGAEVYVIKAGIGVAGPGEEGELVHRGPLVSLGYWGRPDLTADKIRPCPELAHLIGGEKVVYSGDTVRLDEDGDLWFVARNDAMIKTSGFRLSPDEVEDLFSRAGFTSDVVAYGVEDDQLGQAVHVAVTPRDGFTPDALMKHCRKVMPHYMIPQKIRVWDTPMPRTASGKLARPEIIRQSRDRND